MKIVTNFSNGNESVTELTLSSEASSLVAQYKNIIREQDAKIQSVNEKFKELQLQNENLTVSGWGGVNGVDSGAFLVGVESK